MLAPALGQHVLFLRLQHREPADFVQIARQAGFGGYDRQGGGTGHGSALSLFAPIRRAVLVTPPPEPETATHHCNCEARPQLQEPYTESGVRRKLRVRHIALM